MPLKMQSEATGEGSPLVLVPGGLTGWLSWIPFAERLSATRKVVRVQLLSVQLGLEGQPLPTDYSPRTEMQALAATLKDMDISPPVDFAAWSYGAEVTLDFALDNPALVRTLTLIEPPAFWALPSMDGANRELEKSPPLSRENVTEEQLEEFVQWAALVPPGVNPSKLPQWPLWLQHRQSLRANPYVNEYAADRQRFSGFAAPVLLVKGKDSTPAFHQIIDELEKELPNARVVEWPGGHAPHIVSMEQFLEEMARFQANDIG